MKTLVKLILLSVLVSVVNGQEPAKQKPSLICFTATWCPNCQNAKPTWESMKRAGYDVIYIDIDQRPSIKNLWKVSDIPVTIVATQNGREIQERYRIVGFTQSTTPKKLKDCIALVENKEAK